MPIHRLEEKPTRRGVLADLTCDSDGKICQFIDQRDVKDVLELHAPNGAPYYIGVFLVGAYQEILGDLHNLFGDTDAVHVKLDEEGGYTLEGVVEGDDVTDVLRYLQYDHRWLIEKVRGRSRRRRDGAPSASRTRRACASATSRACRTTPTSPATRWSRPTSGNRVRRFEPGGRRHG